MSSIKKNAVEETVEVSENKVKFDESKDFEFVQLDSSIHDQKFKTKPTTFIKDALKRFVKNKSSVVAASILGALILMAIFVPLIDRNDIDHNNDIAVYLPPKWFNKHNGGFFDGTGKVSNVTIDPDTGLPAADDNGNYTYMPSGVVGGRDGITLSPGYADNPSPVVMTRGEGGCLSISSKEGDEVYDAYLYSAEFKYDTDANYSLSVSLNKEYCEEVGNFPSVSLALFTKPKKQEYYKLTESSNTYGTITVDNVTSIIKALDTSLSGEINAYVGVIVEGNEMGMKTTAYVESIELKKGTEVVATGIDEKNNVVSFTSGVASYESYKIAGQGENGAEKGLYHAIVTTGSFTYDYYAAAYCDDVGSFTKTDMDNFYDYGYLTQPFDWDNKNSFQLTPLGEKMCPARSVIDIDANVWGDTESWSATCVRSRYRFFYYKGYISQCKPMNFFFGTDSQGHDFFKVVFAGLLTSLELGFLASIINITIGVVWGAISGYFGGWVDMLMERLTEILGGMPWIVLMTLIVLMFGESNFWIFLLALCLTGWIGTSVTTRSQFYRYKGREYVLASRTLGASDWRLIFQHILPNGIGTIVTGAVLMIPGVIFSEASISYLLPGALSFQGATSFGLTLSTAQGYIQQYPYMIISASIVMSLIMICFNLFGNGLRDAFNPTTKGASI
ncbi:MAG: ABC transporter permease [Bacilli bacterium]|nr:ABC transporter permease [Bacilli bacterium]